MGKHAAKTPLRKPMRIGVVRSRFNEEITEKLEEGALDYLQSFDDDIEVMLVQVPGAVEIPLACQALFRQGCAGVVALGAVIRGDTSHYDTVCNSVERGVTKLMLDWGRPIGFGVLTTENEDQAWARAGGDHGNKGTEAAQVAMEMIGLLEGIATTDSILAEDSEDSEDAEEVEESQDSENARRAAPVKIKTTKLAKPAKTSKSSKTSKAPQKDLDKKVPSPKAKKSRS